ncbi:MAG: hypothetical protein O7C59_02835 [Rickettsia endosymbiont of Ixodes persulcatus]|nr:hypothetical protein [Rickettsia endosymbiont of Ixodes persulcatus]MCZ6909792.1 hypothetical protein [Rickettsia endosymbiont of Ixodes persulcatus]MCZ6913521.1 hypothetical protein [Rickettsia endosymbiont of Ixodes persulcatus]MCZ6920206.1 hypothetical protein [Rickettsia endosymbiont of Ixodes persulcatus]MCZ6926001.1 hypothetical protein [Rickettsia endosymbiont of Ixodes persulcatus]
MSSTKFCRTDSSKQNEYTIITIINNYYCIILIYNLFILILKLNNIWYCSNNINLFYSLNNIKLTNHNHIIIIMVDLKQNKLAINLINANSELLL